MHAHTPLTPVEAAVQADQMRIAIADLHRLSFRLPKAVLQSTDGQIQSLLNTWNDHAVNLEKQANAPTQTSDADQANHEADV